MSAPHLLAIAILLFLVGVSLSLIGGGIWNLYGSRRNVQESALDKPMSLELFDVEFNLYTHRPAVMTPVVFFLLGLLLITLAGVFAIISFSINYVHFLQQC
jgi:hypothetical protein